MKFNELKNLIEEYESLEQDLEEMEYNWDSNDPCAQACSDPSDQFMLSKELDSKEEEIKDWIKCNLKLKGDELNGKWN